MKVVVLKNLLYTFGQDCFSAMAKKKIMSLKSQKNKTMTTCWTYHPEKVANSFTLSD